MPSEGIVASMPGREQREHAAIAVRWSDAEVGAQRSERLRYRIGVLVRELPMEAVRRALQPGLELMLIEGPAFQSAARAWALAQHLHAELVGSLGEPVTIAIDVRTGPTIDGYLDAFLQQLLDETPSGFVASSAVLADHLRDSELERLAPRRMAHGEFAYLFPPPADTETIALLRVLRGRPARLPHRFVRPGGEPLDPAALTKEGLLSPERVPDAAPLDALLRGPRTILIVGDPWAGKSFCATALHGFERQFRGPGRAFLQALRDRPPNLALESDWAAWVGSEDEATVILDGVDDALFQRVPLERVLDPVTRLDAAQRARLRLLAFTRDDASVEAVRRLLDDPAVFRLLPVDAVEAARELGVPSLERALERASRVRAPVPLSMEWLKTLASPDLDDDDASDELLVRICREGIDDDRIVSKEALLRVASRMAAVLTFSELRALPTDSGRLGVSVVASRIAGEDEEALRAFLGSAALKHESDGYVFRSRQTQETLAARAFEDLTEEAVVRELLTDATGRLRVRLASVADAMTAGGSRWTASLERWRKREPLPRVPEKDALSVLDAIVRLEEPQLPWSSRAMLARLDHPNVRDRIHQLLADRSLRSSVRELLLELGTTFAPQAFVKDSLGIALSDDEDLRLRSDAAYVVRAHGDASQVERLRTLVRFARSGDRQEQRLGALALTALVERDLVPVLEAASQAPPPSSAVRDVRSGLFDALSKRVALGDARAVLGRVSRRLPNEAPTLPEHSLRKLSDASLQKIEDDDAPWDEGLARDVAHLIRFGQLRFEERIEPLVEARLTRDGAARQLLYRASLPDRPHYVIRNALTNDDAAWLLAFADELGEHLPEHVGKDLDHLLWTLPAEDPHRERIAALLAARLPSQWAEWSEDRRLAPEMRARWQQERRDREAKERARAAPRRTLASTVDEVMGVRDPTDRLRFLSRLCFAGAPAYSNVDGSFERLPRERRAELIAEVRRLVGRAEPSEVPPVGESFFSTVTDDSAAFQAAVLWDHDTSWLSGALVRAWLPLALFDHQEERTEVARRCMAADSLATLEVAERMVERDARGSRYASEARALPAEIWSERRFRQRVLQLLGDETIPVEGRRPLLHVAVARMARPDVLPVVRAQAAGDGALRTDAVATLLLFDQSAALDLAEPSIVGLKTAADALRALFDRTELPPTDLDRFPTADLLRIACILARHVTFTDPRPRGQAYSPNDEMHLYELRVSVLERLGQRPDFTGLEQLLACIADPSAKEGVRRWMLILRDSTSIRQILAPLGASEDVPPSASRVLDALDGARAVWLRSVADLYDLIKRGLEQRAAVDTPDYIELLRGVNTIGTEREWPHERSLQAYLHLRIREILAYSAQHRADVMHREVQEAAGNDRPDFVLVSVKTVVDPSNTFELPIEVKWSHHKDCVASLTEQLGRRYVVEKKRTHGLYVVGFTGHGTKHSNAAALAAALDARRTSFEAEHGVRIATVLIPCVRSSFA